VWEIAALTYPMTKNGSHGNSNSVSIDNRKFVGKILKNAKKSVRIFPFNLSKTRMII
jgi:hypothetical protein